MPEARGRSSVTVRLAVALVLILGAGGVIVALAALAYGRAAADRSFDRILIGAANQIAAATALRDGRVQVDLPVSAFELLALAPNDRIVYAVVGPNDALLTGYPDLAPPQPDQTFFDGIFTGEPARFAVATRRFAERSFSGTVHVVVGQTTRARRELARDITRSALILVGATGLLMAALAVVAVRMALRPLARIEARLATRAPQDLNPIDVEVPREIGGLVDTLNRFMARIERQIVTMRTLIADASHQLRTPVAALRAQADLAAEETDPENQRAIVERIHQRSVNLSRLTDQLLSHAMIIHRADAAPLEGMDLRTVAVRAVEESDHDLSVSDADLTLDLPEEPIAAFGDELSLVEACKNLIGNALRYGQPPVTVSTGADDSRAFVAVYDRGPGLPESHWADAGRRYSSRSGVSSTSAGLGLAIVLAVARAHDGELRFRRPPGGGFEAALLLPKPAEPPA